MKRFALLFLAVLCLTGCSGTTKADDKRKESIEQRNTTLSYEISNQGITDSKKEITFNYKDEMPIMCNGILYGYVSIKQCEKLGIWDWYNKEAEANNIRTSYTINLQYDLRDDIGLEDSRKFICEAFTIDASGELTGGPCCVGWSGFSSDVVLFNDTLMGRLEIGVQPTSKLTKSTKLLLRFSDSKGTTYDDIIVGNSVFKNAKKGPSLLTKNEKSVIKSVNGAKYFITIKNPSVEEQLKSTGELDDFYSFEYMIGYLKKPIKNVDVAKFDEYKKMKMSSKLVVGVSSQSDKKILYNNYPKAKRFIYSNSVDEDDTEYYVATKDVYLGRGAQATYTDNRRVPSTATTKPEYLRFRVEFPEERAARTDDEMMKFNGRFIVYQIAPEERKLDAKPE